MEKLVDVKVSSGIKKDMPLPQGVPTQLAPLVVVFSEWPVPLPIGSTLSQ
jgi:hypothetical protein